MQDNKLRLYLDYYPAITNPATGKATRREFLRLFIYSDIELQYDKYSDNSGKELIRISQAVDGKGQPKRYRLSALERQHNKETLELAENIKAQRILQIQAQDYGFLTEDKHADFLAFFKEIADKKKEQKNNNNYNSTLTYFSKFCNNNCPMGRLTHELCEDFRDYLESVEAFKEGRAKLSYNTTSVYYSIFLNVLRIAVKRKLLSEYPAKDLARIKRKNTSQREFLTIEELQAVANTPCKLPMLKQAALFSSFTGLRWSDIKKLKWDEIVDNSEGHSIRFLTKKTNDVSTLPISEQARGFCGTRKGDTEAVFPSLVYGSWQNTVLDRWVREAGINKHITFHCFRHTYATLQITNGTDIYVLADLMGHKDISTTKIYGKIVSEKKKEAASKISLVINQ